MQRPQITGSSPRKFIKRTILTNPSLISLSVTSLLDPENQSLPKICDALSKRLQAVIKNDSRIISQISPINVTKEASVQQKPKVIVKEPLDSLQQAEQQFLLSKKTAPQPKPQEEDYRSPLLTKKELGKELSFMSRRSSLPTLPSYHYASTNQIKVKQTKPYNIINNI